MKNQVVFVDTDVVISSLISTTGAAYLLLQKKKLVDFWLSNLSKVEIDKVIDRLKLSPSSWQEYQSDFKYSKIDRNSKIIRQQYGPYVHDVNDAHVIAGAIASRAQYLLTYNIKHYTIEKLKDLNIIVLTPGQFLQYLRSRA